MRERVTVTLKKDLLDQVDRMVDGLSIRSRSQALEFLLSKVLSDIKIKYALVLAGGEKSKILIDKKPKFALDIHGKSLLTHALDHLHTFNVNHFLIYLDNYASEIKQAVKKENVPYGVEFLEEKAPKGTIEPLQMARTYFNDTFLLAYGDTVCKFNLNEMLQFHREHKSLATLALTTVSNPKEYGVVSLNGSKITEFVQKPKQATGSYLISTGYFLFEPEIFKYISRTDASLEKDLLPRLATKGLLYGYPFQGMYLNINTKKDLERARILL